MQRPSDYSDAYDGDQPEAESTGLMINPAVAAVVASKAAMVTSPILPGVVVTGNRRPVRGTLELQLHAQALPSFNLCCFFTAPVTLGPPVINC